jgi:glutamate racemase
MIGFYDSGVGGLSILQEVSKQLSGYEFIYYGDTAHNPLGEKSPDQIYEITRQGVEFLFKKGCTVVVLACNTATSIAIRKLQNEWLPTTYPEKRVLGIVRPVSEYLIDHHISKDSQILLCATPATIASQFYIQELNDVGYTNIVPVAFPGLAYSIEQGDEAACDAIISTVFQSHRSLLADTTIALLVCTHYPIIYSVWSKYTAQYTRILPHSILDQTEMISYKLLRYFTLHPEKIPQKGPIQIYTSGDLSVFLKRVNRLYPNLLSHVSA